MTSSKPYLLRGLYEWIVDEGLTPYLLVNTAYPGTQVPTAFIKNDRIVLDVSPVAVKGLVIGNEWIEFDARFGPKMMRILVPVPAVLAIYSKEGGGGMEFPEEVSEEGSTGTSVGAPAAESENPTSSGKKPKLTLVKK